MSRFKMGSAVVLMFAFIGCANRSNVPGHYKPQIVYSGTDAFDTRVATLSIKPDDAQSRAAASWPAQCLIDEWYVFDRVPHKEARIDLNGTYVNGLTGAAEHRDDTRSLIGDTSFFNFIRGYPGNMPDHLPATTTATDGYKLVWSDEFNTDGPLNPRDWSFEQGFVRNGEVQWYQPDNATCANGMLVIEARRESKPNPLYKLGAKTWPASQPSLEYTSASVETRGKHEWLYGRFEMRAKIDTRQGSWPAFWTLGKSGGWPACGEIDIMESYQHMLLANIAWAQHGGANGSKWNTARMPLEKFDKDWSSQFHLWRMDWDADSIKLYCDDHLLNTQDLSQTLNPDGKNPFHQPLYLKLNQALGGSCGGDPSKTEFPIRFTIDYVRIYQKN